MALRSCTYPDQLGIKNATSLMEMKPDVSSVSSNAGIQGILQECIGGCHRVQLWLKPLKGNGFALAFLNLSPDRLLERVCIRLPKAVSSEEASKAFEVCRMRFPRRHLSLASSALACMRCWTI